MSCRERRPLYRGCRMALLVILLGFCRGRADAQSNPRLVVVGDRGQERQVEALRSSLTSWTSEDIIVDRESDLDPTSSVMMQLCSALSSSALVVDLTWSGWEMLRQLSLATGTPYVQADVSIRPFLQAADDVLRYRNVTDAALIFESEEALNQGIYYLVGRSPLRVVVLAGLQPQMGPSVRRPARTSASPTERLAAMRPTPSMHVILAAAGELETLTEQAANGGVVGRYTRWMLVDTALAGDRRDVRHLSNTTVPVTVLTPRASLCCVLRDGVDVGGSSCRCGQPQRLPGLLVPAIARVLGQVAAGARERNVALPQGEPQEGGKECPQPATEPAANNKAPVIDILREVVSPSSGLVVQPLVFLSEAALLADLVLDVTQIPPGDGDAEPEQVGEWSTVAGYVPKEMMAPLRKFFRIGVVESLPWAYRQRDGSWTGYCVDFAYRLSELMNFDLELVPADTYGERNLSTGRWSGALGDLVAGKTDILAADLTMTAQREEAIDFVPPYFEQSGISIVIRKPIRKTSLFKFMTVLRLEVWLSIVAALVVTAFMVWLLDRFSPYSARNTKYPYPCRMFTLKESFWFALTSFTPQGGGEAPKALSGRTLVAAYWLFVVLMLATFTANLAAFLTVERMQTPVQSLEQLARQSRINYTVVEGSDTHMYFKNMKHAEETLYRVWKEITLNASSDDTQYRVWDYPIKEQYGHILLAIERTGTLPNASVGFQKVQESEDAEFAFIHTAAYIRYEVSKNCNLTEVGDVFAEQPYALAIQQGSYLQEELSRKILDLQKDRYFEMLTAKYWNYSKLQECTTDDDNEGITLESLGGVFIATLCGLVFALITLGAEVFYYKRKELMSVTDSKQDPKQGKSADTADGSTVKSVMARGLPAVENEKAVLLSKESLATLAKLRKNAFNTNQQVPQPGAVPALPTISEGTGRNPGVTYITVFPRADLY